MKKLIRFALVLLLLLLSGCGNSYSEDDLQNAEHDAYNEGYNDGYNRGAKDQMEKDYENLLIDGRSIRDIENEIYEEFGMTPHEAFSIVDNYEYDYTHGGYTWNEYQTALDAIFYTVSIFPYDY